MGDGVSGLEPYQRHVDAPAGWEQDGRCVARTQGGERCARGVKPGCEWCPVHSSAERVGKRAEAERLVHELVAWSAGSRWMSVNGLLYRWDDRVGWTASPREDLHAEAEAAVLASVSSDLVSVWDLQRAARRSADAVVIADPGYEAAARSDVVAIEPSSGVVLSGAVVCADAVLTVGGGGVSARRMHPMERWWCRDGRVPWEWGDGEGGETPMFDSQLERAGVGWCREWLLLMMGAAICGAAASLRTCVVLVGEGGAGKSTLLRLMSAVIGGVHLDSLDDLAGDFGGAALLGWPRLVTVDELPSRPHPTAVTRLKSITGGGGLAHVNAKNQPQRTVPLRALVVCASNEVPRWARSAADLRAWTDRLAIIEFEAADDGERFPNHADAIYAAEGAFIGRSAVRLWAAHQAAGGGLPERPREMIAATRRVLSSGIAAGERWLSECVRKRAGCVVERDALVSSFERWCALNDVDGSNPRASKIVPTDIGRVITGLVADRYGAKRRRDGCYVGVRIVGPVTDDSIDGDVLLETSAADELWDAGTDF